MPEGPRNVSVTDTSTPSTSAGGMTPHDKTERGPSTRGAFLANARIIFFEELRRHIRSRWYLISTAAVVVILLVAMVVVPSLLSDDDSGAGSGIDLTKIGYVDEGGGFAALGGDDSARQFADREQGVQALVAGEIEWLYVLPADYMQSGRVEEYGEFAGRFPSNPAGEAVFQSLLVSGLLAGKIDPAIEARALAPATYESYRVEEDGTISNLAPTAQSIGSFLVPLLFAGLLATGLAVGAGTMVQSIADEKESRLVEVVITSTSPFSLLLGKLLALVTIGLVQAAVWIIATAITIPTMFRNIAGMGEFKVSASLWLLIVGCFVMGYFLITALAILVAAIAPSAREASGMGSWVSLVTFVPIWFSGILISQPEGLASRLFSYIPFTAPTGILVRISAGGEMRAWGIGVALAGVAVTGVIVIWIATRIFRAAILMRGQKVSARNLWAALRRAG